MKAFSETFGCKFFPYFYDAQLVITSGFCSQFQIHTEKYLISIWQINVMRFWICIDLKDFIDIYLQKINVKNNILSKQMKLCKNVQIFGAVVA